MERRASRPAEETPEQGIETGVVASHPTWTFFPGGGTRALHPAGVGRDETPDATVFKQALVSDNRKELIDKCAVAYC